MEKPSERICSETNSNRIERIRRMIEEGVDSELHSPQFVSRAAADLAAQRHHHKGHENTQLDLKLIFSDMRLSVIKAVEDGDEVIVRWRLRGKWTGALPFAPKLKPNGASVDFTGSNVYRFVGDKIVDKTSDIDAPSFVKQLVAGGGLSAEACVEALTAVSRPPDMIGRVGEL
jgi:predicted ester cyclase